MAVLHLQLCLLAIIVVCTKGSYMFSDTIILDNGNYNVSYNFNESVDTIEVLLEVKTTGWVGFGFALNAPTSMQGYDVAVGGVLSNGTGYLQDYLTGGFRIPPLDSQQDWMLISSNEQNGVTTLKFYRKRNTTDEQDVAIEQGVPINLIWAYHSSNDVEPGQFNEHSVRGHLERTLIPAITSTVPVSAGASTMVGTMSTSMAEMTTSSMAAMTTSTMAAMTTSTMAAMTTSTMAEITTSTMAAMTTSTMAEMTTSIMETMTTSTMAAMTTPTMAEMTTSIMETMTTSTMAEMTISTMAPMSTSTTPAIEPTTTATPSAASSSVVTPTPDRPEHFANFVSFNGNYNASWMFNSSMDTLHFMVEVKARGWVGFGFATQAPNNMKGYDVAVGGVRGGSEGYLKDYFTNGFRGPPVDSQQDWMLSYSREENGVTTLRFYRKLNTNDENDVVIEQGMSIFLIWAYHPTDDVQPGGQFSGHSSANRGFKQVTLIQPVQPVHFANFLSFNNGNYNASWMFNSSMDTLHFMVEVKARGWVGFGFATQAPNSMRGYDVAVGGVRGGSEGYLKDYLTDFYEKPPEDSQQDWKLMYSREENDITTLRFYRKLNTNDDKDVVIQQGKPIFLIWAYHSTNDVQTPSGQFGQHDRRGSQQVTLIPEFIHSYDNNRFRLLWRFDDQNDKMVFHLRVKTTGWVGFGFAETAPNNMMNYDVIVGGFSNGKGYLQDYFTRGRVRPAPDANQDYNLLGASEVGGYTELIFERPRDTKDDNDLTFMPGREVYLIWAYDDMDVTDAGIFFQHSTSGVSPKKVVLVSEQPIPTEGAASSLHTSLCGIVFLTILLWF